MGGTVIVWLSAFFLLIALLILVIYQVKAMEQKIEVDQASPTNPFTIDAWDVTEYNSKNRSGHAIFSTHKDASKAQNSACHLTTLHWDLQRQRRQASLFLGDGRHTTFWPLEATNQYADFIALVEDLVQCACTYHDDLF